MHSLALLRTNIGVFARANLRSWCTSGDTCTCHYGASFCASCELDGHGVHEALPDCWDVKRFEAMFSDGQNKSLYDRKGVRRDTDMGGWNRR